VITVHPGGGVARRRGRQRGQPFGQAGVVGWRSWPPRPAGGGQLAPPLRQFGVGAADEGGDLGVQCRDALPQRIASGQPSGQPLGGTQPARGQLLLHLLARGLERAPGEHGGGDQPGLVLHQAELARLPGDGPLDEAPARELPQPLDDLRQEQGIEITGRARGAAQDGQDVLGGRLARGGVGQRVRLTARLVERRLVEAPGVGEPEPAQHAEAMADGVAEDDLRGQPLAELAHMLGQVGLLGVRRGGQLGERGNHPDPGPLERLGDLRVGDGPAERAAQPRHRGRPDVGRRAGFGVGQPGELVRLLAVRLRVAVGEPSPG
jgi:hypothetical protein